LENKVADWRAKGVKVLSFYTGPPAPRDETAGDPAQPAYVNGFHCGEGKTVFDMARARQLIEQELPKENHVFLAEYPLSKLAEEERTLNELFGPGTVVNPEVYGAPKRARKMRVAPQPSQYMHYFTSEDPTTEMTDGTFWKMPVDKRLQRRPNVVLRGYLCQLMKDQVFGRALGKADKEALAEMRQAVIWDPTNTTWVSRKVWYKWLGLEGALLVSVLDRNYPCAGKINAATQLPPRRNTEEQTEDCGVTLYCKVCEQLFRQLGKIGHVLTKADVLIDVFMTAEKSWKEGSAQQRPATLTTPIHVCGPGLCLDLFDPDEMA
jgi:hypothetical protein